MSDEFQLASSGNWWDSPRTARFTAAPTSTSAAQIAVTAGSSYGWPPPDLSTDNFKTRSIDSSDPNLHMMGLGLSSQPIDWHQNIFGGGKNENTSSTSFRSMLQLEDHMNHDEEFKQSNLGFSLDHHHQQQQQQMMDPMAYGSPSTILQGSLASHHPHHHQQEIYQSSYGMNSNGLLPSWSPKYPTHLLRPNQSVMQQQQQQFSGNVSFWNTEGQTNFFPPSPPPTFTQSRPSIEQKPKIVVEAGETESVGKKNNTEASNKRQRSSSETVPSSSPAFKVKKEKMGDRITALQQLVSPFGKTDTASVLSEAIDYIKFLHEQVSVLSNPYMKSGAPPSMQHHKMIHDNSKDEESKQDLRSRGLCLVPVMSTFAVTHDTTVDFWNPTFGGTFR
ncbi:transcription factor bHLH123-like isoform X2 [Impatiens glandulifera]|uniref:transcription factor bHLH123-like isoform X2 n=1 Tax=Impatiens glandulifera TaxID=253017 RepID=UPI001FB15766|nr:transcription factor bHLH123-like isoform X2 [Impatiens glandulifera]